MGLAGSTSHLPSPKLETYELHTEFFSGNPGPVKSRPFSWDEVIRLITDSDGGGGQKCRGLKRE